MHPRALVFCAAVAACVPTEPQPGSPPAAPCTGLVTGDLVITEIFADRAGGPDAGDEWIEIASASERPVELTGIAVVHSRVDGSREKRVVLTAGAVAAGAYHVLGSADEPVDEPLDTGYGDRLGELFNSGGGRIALLCGAVTVDTATYGDARAGRSLQLGDPAPDATLNDDPGRWCLVGDGVAELSPGNRGTPGAANPPCEAAPPDDGGGDGTCDDGGVARPAVAPVAGDLQITEVMANPAGTDGTAEWLEVRAGRSVDLNGVIVGRDPESDDHRSPITSPRCLRVAAGGHAVIARSLDPAVNGGLPAPAATASFSLLNGDGQVFVAAADGTVLDSLAWDQAPDGASLQRAARPAVPGDRDDPRNRCVGTVDYGPGGRGTPGAADDCGPCLAACGQCLDGTRVRAIATPAPGDLAIVEWMANPEGLDGDRGEYIEIRARTSIDLNGLELGRTAAAVEPVVTADACVRLGTGQRALFGHDGGDPPRMDGTFRFALVQSNGSIVAARDGTVLDEVSYPAAAAGQSTAIDDAGWTCTTPADARYRYNRVDHGTPRQPNPRCP